jgi:hypothetical protein
MVRCQDFKSLRKSLDCECENFTYNMSKTKKPRTLAEQIADLDDPAPKGTFILNVYILRKLTANADFDLEDINSYENQSEDDDTDGGEEEARAHYELVGYVYSYL